MQSLSGTRSLSYWPARLVGAPFSEREESELSFEFETGGSFPRLSLLSERIPDFLKPVCAHVCASPTCPVIGPTVEHVATFLQIKTFKSFVGLSRVTFDNSIFWWWCHYHSNGFG